jgi:alpha-mannosidase
MKDYPNYSFMESQPQLLQFLKEEHPELYLELKERVKEGRWEIDGAMWLEADCNLISGESLIRQILYGKRFILEEFGVNSKTLWLPDVFGYSAALPQILKKFGINYFVTSKISWNETNKMPYDTFMWEGIDGTDVMTYFITTAEYDKVVSGNQRTVYEGKLNPSQIMGAWRRYQQKNINDEVLVAYGHGDGGGGPTKEMLEYSTRMEKGIPGCPTVKMTRLGDYLEDLSHKVEGNPKLPRWVGELYLEYHRGTYTSMARNKNYNRKSEFLFQDIERFSLFANSIDIFAEYPTKELEAGWKTIMLNQFHDIIPGSSIKEVYEESQEQYEKLLSTGGQLLDKSMKYITNKIELKEKSVIVFNALGFERSDIITFDLPDDNDLDSKALVDAKGKIYPIQKTEEGRFIAFVEGIPANGYKAFAIRASLEPIPFVLYASEKTIGNRFFEITFDECAQIISIYDKTEQREVIKSGAKGNVLQAFEDKPHNYDAWDINIYYQEKMWEIGGVVEIQVVERGPVRAAIRVKKRFMDSTLVQYIYIYNDIPRIDFGNEIDWKEKQILLKVSFPVDVHTDKATYDIQFGSIERPTHWNTSWDIAKFEVCAHKWADLSEDGYGVSLLNDSKYGYDIKDGVMRLSLLKSPIWPNPVADQELHRFAYSIYPHAGNWREGNTMQMAYRFNRPMVAISEDCQDGILPAQMSMVGSDKNNVIIDTIKKAEDGQELIIRLYEGHNRRTVANLDFFKEIKYAAETDLDEKEIAVIETKNNILNFEIFPHEIKTFKIILA